MVSADEAVRSVRSGDSVYIGSAGSTPKVLVEALARRCAAGELVNIKLRHIHTAEISAYGGAKPIFTQISENQFLLCRRTHASECYPWRLHCTPNTSYGGSLFEF